MYEPVLPLFLPSYIINRINVGIFVIDEKLDIVVWNKFMETNSGKSTAEVYGKNIFECFPELPRMWFERKVKSVFLLKNFAFTSWRQRPYLFRFPHHRPVTGGVDSMRQDCTFLPVLNDRGEVKFICITLIDVTETSIYQTMLNETMLGLEKLSQKDALTGLLNRREFTRQLDREFKRALRYGKELSFALIDLDHFKKVNDTYGHLAGDEILRQVSRLCVNSMRDTDIVARFGGEEFAVLFPEQGEKGAMEAIERFRKQIEKEAMIFETQSISVTISAGVSALNRNTKDANDLIRKADAALYESKKNGRNQTTLFHS
ncbi:MAG: diguanylate cyclase [Candidatus Omnitrophota bacterium]|jgi:diguanylate cyclase (GGDEF)-like protein|nr:MAG: diguanylate cyclase [Candidatus Omnitrophota bacterium]